MIGKKTNMVQLFPGEADLGDYLCLKQSMVKECYGPAPSNFDDSSLVSFECIMDFLPTYSLLRCLMPQSGYNF